MADDKEFDIETIKNGESMDALDKLYFEKFGGAMDEQAEKIAEEHDIDLKYMNEVFDSLMETLYNNDDEYLVHGALLKCSKMVKTRMEQEFVYQGDIIISKPTLSHTMMELQTPKIRKKSANGMPFANVSDTTGGMRGELLKKKGELNITSFGNCEFLDEENIKDVEEMAERVYSTFANSSEYTGITKDMVLNGILKAIQENKGTCFCCMALNYEWENLPAEYDYVDNTFSTEASRPKSYMQYSGKEAINMMSMLFCGFGGGIINAEESGQRRENLTVPEKLWRDIKKMGYNDLATAAIMGNISWESGGYNIDITQDGGRPEEKGVGIGLCQWTLESRKQGLFQLGTELGLAWDTYELQIRYLEYELLEGTDFTSVRPEKMNEYTDLDSATEHFMWKFENPEKDEAHLEDRQERAKKALKDYGEK